MGCASYCTCCIFCSLLLVSPFVILITLSYVGVEPRFYIQDIYIPALNNSHIYNASNLNTSVFIDLKFKRVVNFVPIRYTDGNITLFYESNRSLSLGNSVVPAFGQGKKRTVHRKVVVEAHGLPWEDAFQKISGGSTVALGLEFSTKYSIKRCDEDSCWYSKPNAMVVAADLRLDATGHMISQKPIRLR